MPVDVSKFADFELIVLLMGHFIDVGGLHAAGMDIQVGEIKLVIGHSFHGTFIIKPFFVQLFDIQSRLLILQSG